MLFQRPLARAQELLSPLQPTQQTARLQTHGVWGPAPAPYPFEYPQEHQAQHSRPVQRGQSQVTLGIPPQGKLWGTEAQLSVDVRFPLHGSCC